MAPDPLSALSPTSRAHGPKPPTAPTSPPAALRLDNPTRLDVLGRLGRQALGRRRDWAVPAPDLHRLRPGAGLVGPLALVASVVAGWFAFAGAQGEGPVALGLFLGAASIVLMAWSFVLAIRLRPLEPLFGGLDRAYQAHRWAGTLSVLFMFLHVRLEPEVDGGVLGASQAVADAAEGLAGVGEYLLYGLVGISLIRWFPYRWWRLTHKLLGVPFVFAAWHFVTAEKTYANNSPWGWYFGSIMAVGVVAWLWRVVVRDMVRPGRSHTVTAAEVDGTTLELRLRPDGRRIRHRAGQFVALKVQLPGLREPHLFTIASSPGADELRFYIRDLGDWTARMLGADLAGARVIVEGPYGRFEPLGAHGRPVLWVAGGVGITPFLSAIDSLEPVPEGRRPLLVYCVRDRAGATAMAELELAEADGRIDLEVVASSEGRRLDDALLTDVVARRPRAGTTPERPLAEAHVALCGPAGLLSTAASTARRLGAAEVESEAFDIRSGVGPDLSRPLDELVRAGR